MLGYNIKKVKTCYLISIKVLCFLSTVVFIFSAYQLIFDKYQIQLGYYSNLKYVNISTLSLVLFVTSYSLYRNYKIFNVLHICWTSGLLYTTTMLLTYTYQKDLSDKRIFDDGQHKAQKLQACERKGITHAMECLEPEEYKKCMKLSDKPSTRMHSENSFKTFNTMTQSPRKSCLNFTKGLDLGSLANFVFEFRSLMNYFLFSGILISLIQFILRFNKWLKI